MPRQRRAARTRSSPRRELQFKLVLWYSLVGLLHESSLLPKCSRVSPPLADGVDTIAAAVVVNVGTGAQARFRTQPTCSVSPHRSTKATKAVASTLGSASLNNAPTTTAAPRKGKTKGVGDSAAQKDVHNENLPDSTQIVPGKRKRVSTARFLGNSPYVPCSRSYRVCADNDPKRLLRREEGEAGYSRAIGAPDPDRPKASCACRRGS